MRAYIRKEKIPMLKLCGACFFAIILFGVVFNQSISYALQDRDVVVTDPIDVTGTSLEGAIPAVVRGESVTATIQIDNLSEVEIPSGLEIQISLETVVEGTASGTPIAVVGKSNQTEIGGAFARLSCVNVGEGSTGVDSATSAAVATCQINRQLDVANTDQDETGDSATVQIALDTSDLEADVTYLVTAMANPDQRNFSEPDQTNNQGSGRFTVFPVRPNLIIPANVSFSPSSPRQGDLLQIEFEVENDSLQDIDTAFTTSISFREVIPRNGNNQFDPFIELVPPAISCPLCLGMTIPNGERQTVQAQIPTTLISAGSYQFRIEIDSTGVAGVGLVDETDESDNILIFDLALGQPPRNLALSGGQVVQSLSSNTASVLFDVTNTSAVAAQNVGLSIELEPSEDTLALIGEEFTQPTFTCTPALSFVGGTSSTTGAPCDTITQLRPGETLSVRASFDVGGLELGDYSISIALDPTDQFDELNENDNSLSVLFVRSDQPQGGARGPELRPVSLDLVPDSPVTQGTSILVTTNIKNSGNQNAENFIVRFSIRPEDGSSVGFVAFETKLIKLLKVGIDMDVKATLQTSGLDPGLYSIQVDLISTDQTELDENNNSIRAQFSIVESGE